MALKKPGPNQKGLKKLPENVRNKMGFAKKGKRRNKKQVGGPMDPNMQDPNMMPQDPMMDQSVAAPGEDFIEPETQIKFGAPRDKKFLGGNKFARQERRANRQAMRQERRALRQETRGLPRADRRAARQALRQEQRAGMAPGMAQGQEPMDAATAAPTPPAAVAKPGAPEATAGGAPSVAQRMRSPAEIAGGPMRQQMAKPGAGGAAFKNGGRKAPREKALFGKIAGAIGGIKRAKKEGKKLGSGLLKEAAKGALAGGTLGRIAGAAQGFFNKENKGKGLRNRLRQAGAGAIGGFNNLANSEMAEAARTKGGLKDYLKDKVKGIKDKLGGKGDKPKEEGRRRQPMAPPMTAMVKNGARKGMVDRRRKKTGGYAIEKTASGKQMADTLGVEKNRKKATGGIRRTNKINKRIKGLESDIQSMQQPVNQEGAKRMDEGKSGPGKLKRELERKRARVEKLTDRKRRINARKRSV